MLDPATGRYIITDANSECWLCINTNGAAKSIHCSELAAEVEKRWFHRDPTLRVTTEWGESCV